MPIVGQSKSGRLRFYRGLDLGPRSLREHHGSRFYCGSVPVGLLTVLAVATTAAATIVPAQPLVLFKRVAMQTSTDNSTMPTLPPWYTDLRIEVKIRDDGWVSYKNRS